MARQLEAICRELDAYIRQITLGRLEREAMVRLAVEGGDESGAEDCRHLSSLVSARGLLELVLQDRKTGDDAVAVSDSSCGFSGLFLAVPLGQSASAQVQTVQGGGLSLNQGPENMAARHHRGCSRRSVPARDWNETLYPSERREHLSFRVMDVHTASPLPEITETDFSEIEVEEEIGNAANAPKSGPRRAKKRPADRG
ncbi:hypothetical protein [Roseibium sediminis]|uniref:hypothetical protein n=1 Tax=Roseibium sediminis TaxID=1775174 RepID=UPI00123C8A13|nr:hypothetical protein [Roseibium sediminis]